jgi:two-component system OmpR family response regulator
MSRDHLGVHVLLVEDDLLLGRVLERLLSQDRHVVDWARTGDEALELARMTDMFDAVILDLGLPDMDGLDVVRRLRAEANEVPVLILTARDAVLDRVAGLDAGGDGYMVKPFAYSELTARLRALDRRGATVRPTGLTVGAIAVDETSHTVRVEGRVVELSRREFAVLVCLVRHPGQVLSRDQLLELAWPVGAAVTGDSVDAYMSFLRRKLGPRAGAQIETVRGIGFRMVAT